MIASAGWQTPDSARHYAVGRFHTPRAATRDQRLVTRLLRRHALLPLEHVLDAPCGTGRMHSALKRAAATYVGIDISPAMLGEMGSGAARLAVADVMALPFADDAFDVVVCCRLLHHLRADADLKSAVSELVRVAKRFVIASFFDAMSWQAWRKQLGLKHADRSRRAVPRRVMQDVFARCHAPVIDFASSFRFVSQQVFLMAAKHA